MIQLISFNFKLLDEPIAVRGLMSFVIQHAQVFASFIQGLHQYTEESEDLKIFDRNYKSLKAGEIMVITDILGHDVNHSSVLQLIYKDLEMQISEEPETKTKIEQLLGEAAGLINKELLDFELDLESSEIGLADLFKVMKVKIEIQTDTIFDRMFEVIQAFKYLSKKAVIIFVNVGTYLTEEEIASFEEYVELHHIPVLLVDRYPFKGVRKQVILDEDFVVLSSN